MAASTSSDDDIISGINVTPLVDIVLVLLVGSGLFLRELRSARALDPGFRMAGVSLVRVDASRGDRSPAAAREFFATWLARVRAYPGVEGASLARSVPLGFGRPTTRWNSRIVRSYPAGVALS